jgi:hypothetical protein
MHAAIRPYIKKQAYGRNQGKEDQNPVESRFKIQCANFFPQNFTDFHHP